MEKYDGNQKGFIYVSFDAKDQKEVFEKYLEPLAKDGTSFWWADDFESREEKTLARSGAVLLFLTKEFVKDSRLRDTAAAAVKHDKPVLSVYLEEVELDAALSMQLESQQALLRNNYRSDEEFVDELKKAAIFDGMDVTEQQKKKQKSRSVVAVAAAIVAVLVLALVLKPMLGSGKANEETMEALGLQGLSKEELESITELRIIGNDIIDYNAHAEYTDNGKTTVAYEIWDEGAPSNGAAENTDAPRTAVGNISDLSGLGQLKNLKVLCIEGQQIEDLTPLSELENLELLSVSCNPVKSLKGIEKLSNLKSLDVANTDITDLSPLAGLEKLTNLSLDGTAVEDASSLKDHKRMHYISMNDTGIKELPTGMRLDHVVACNSALIAVPDFAGSKRVFFDFEGSRLEDFTNLSTAGSYGNADVAWQGLFFDEGNNQIDEIVGNLKGIPVASMEIRNANINSMKDLSGLEIQNLAIPYSTIRSLDGIEELGDLVELDITGCENLTDLSPVNKLSGTLHRVVIDEGMSGLAAAVDSSITVEFADSGNSNGAAAEAEAWLKDNWDGGSEVFFNGTGNKLTVSIWDDSSKTADEAVMQRAKEISDGLMGIIENDAKINHVELRYVAADDKNQELIVLEDGEITENAGE